MFYFTVLGKRNKYVLKIGGGKITTQKVERTDSDKEQLKEREVAPLVEKAENERVTAKYLGKRMIEVTANAGEMTVSRIYKETLNINKSAKRIREIAEDFMLEDGICVKEKEIYQAIGKATKGLSGIHIRSYYYYS